MQEGFLLQFETRKYHLIYWLKISSIAVNIFLSFVFLLIRKNHFDRDVFLVIQAFFLFLLLLSLTFEFRTKFIPFIVIKSLTIEQKDDYHRTIYELICDDCVYEIIMNNTKLSSTHIRKISSVMSKRHRHLFREVYENIYPPTDEKLVCDISLVREAAKSKAV